MAFASFDTYYFLLSCSLQDIGATLLSTPWQQPLVMLLSLAQTQELSRQVTANKQHGPASLSRAPPPATAKAGVGFFLMTNTYQWAIL